MHLMNSHHQVLPKIGVGINQGIIQVPPPRKTLTTQEVGIFIRIHQFMIKRIMCIIKHLPEQLLFLNSLLLGKEKLVIGHSTTMVGGQVILTEKPMLGDLLNTEI